MLKSKFVRAMAGAALVVGVSSTGASAQMPGVPSVFISGFAGYNIELEELLIGAGVGIPLGPTGLVLNPSFEYYPGIDGITLFTIVADLQYAVSLPASPASPYFGGGLAYSRASNGGITGTTTQFQAKAGIAVGSGPLKPFVEAVYRVNEGSGLVAKAGARIGI